MKLKVDKLLNKEFIREQIDDVKGPLCFQALSWNNGDFDKNSGNEEEFEEKLEFFIHISGVTQDGNSLSLKVKNFHNYFYVEMPDSYKKEEAKKFYEEVKKRLGNESYGLINYEYVFRKKIRPYLGNKKFRFVRLNFKTMKAYKKAKYLFINQEKYPLKISGLDTIKYKSYNHNIDPINSFCHIREIEPSGWIKIEKFKEDLNNNCCQINIIADSENVFPESTKKNISPITILSYDLECLPQDTEKFPDPELESDVICQIGVVIQKYGTEQKQKIIFTNKECNEIPDITVISSKDEKSMLLEYIRLIKLVDPDKIIGYNNWGFDDNYLYKRIELYNIDINHLSRVAELKPELKTKELKSNAFGENKFVYLSFPGRETFDMIVALRRDFKYESYALDKVSKIILNERKVDLKYSILFAKLNGGPDEIAECAEYCVQDASLPLRIYLRLNYLPNFIEMSKATYVPMEWLLFRGQQCRVFSLIAKKAREKQYVIPVHEKTNVKTKFKGATVLTANTGIYYEPVAGLDFASLYPSIIIAYNLCYTTIIEDEETLKYVIENNIPYGIYEWSEIDDETNKTVNHKFMFVKIEDDKGNEYPNGTRGLLSEILLELWKGRKETKKLMATEKEQILKAIYNGKQLAQKVVMNSVYGFTGADDGILPCKQIAATVTAVGRQTIEKTARAATEEFGAFVVYGDSIPGYEIITSKVDDRVIEKSIEDFADEIEHPWKEYRGFKMGDKDVLNKMCKEVSGVLTYTHEGYKPIKRVIKHNTTKKLYKIKAIDSNGKEHQVVVTEGHSLIGKNGELISADKLKIGDRLFNYN